MECKIKELREDRNIKANELSKAAGINRVTLWRIEKNKQKPSITIILKIANYLEVELQELYD